MTKHVIINTDGACRGNPGPGGWGAVLSFNKTDKEIYGGEEHTTNNRMELMASIQALKALKEPCKVTLFTDSMYVKKGISEWMTGWEKKNWKGVKNVDLWKELRDEAKAHTIDWQWVKGHNGDPGNEHADQLANKGIDSL